MVSAFVTTGTTRSKSNELSHAAQNPVCLEKGQQGFGPLKLLGRKRQRILRYGYIGNR